MLHRRHESERRLLRERLAHLNANSIETEVEHYDGSRGVLRQLFELADDSEAAINEYMSLGEIIVAKRDGLIIGHVQLMHTHLVSEIELKSIAVLPSCRCVGIGTKLIEAAVEICGVVGARKLKVSTSIAAFEALGFYLRRGFRICGILRDAFTPERGYPATLRLNGVPLDDAIELDLVIPANIGS